ncbi:MAG: GerMN domain-containing protein [Candidatus Paceibacterota bacterium]|jgi:hypothetical protein|nr:GerMN domain-containing protein [bacterium]
MKKIILYLVLIILLFLGLVFYNYKNKEVNNFESCEKANGILLESYPRQCKSGDGKIYVENIVSEIEKSDLIKVDFPTAGALIDSPLIIRGKARGSWFFEASFPIELIDNKNNVVATGVAMATANSLTEDFVPFESRMEFVNPEKRDGFLVLKNDNPSGLPENSKQIKIPVVINPSQNLIKNKVYFANDNLDPDVTCEKVFSVERSVVKTEAIAQATLQELLKGVTEKEKNDGYRTTINAGVKINSLKIVNGVAKVDFSEAMGEAVGGSCRVNFIRKQIEETLKQFPTVKSVVISINGDSEYILQP